MANLKELRSRISSVSSTMQITSAMKMVSAAKLNKAQAAITAMRPYADKLAELLQYLSVSVNDEHSGLNIYTKQREVKRVLVVAIASNRGLAGAFNTNIIKAVKKLSETMFAGKEIEFFTLGKKVNDVLSKTGSVIANDNQIFDDLSFSNTSVIADKLMEYFSDQTYDKIVIVYNKFKNAASQDVIVDQFLPIIPVASDEDQLTTDYIFEPSKEAIIEDLIPKSLKIKLYAALRDSFASEHGARMTAMHKATDNATELRNSLKLQYNKARQASITNEILEIVGGAEALNG